MVIVGSVERQANQVEVNSPHNRRQYMLDVTEAVLNLITGSISIHHRFELERKEREISC